MTEWSDLLTLQRLDTTIDQLRHRRDHLPERAHLAAVEGEVVVIERRHEELATQLADLRRTQRRLEGEVATMEAREAEVERRLAIGTVAREVQVLSSERDGLRVKRGGLEDQILELMEAAEPLAGAQDAAQAARAEADQRAMAAHVALAEAEVTVAADLARAEEAREGARGLVPEPLLAEYDRLRPRLGGVAVAELLHGHCSGCNLALPASEVERLGHLAPGDRATCEECGRLLVLG